jgi:hypothetical protein
MHGMDGSWSVVVVAVVEMKMMMMVVIQPVFPDQVSNAEQVCSFPM